MSRSADSPPFTGRTALIATMHGKAAALARPLERLGFRMETAIGLDTDRFGAFTGETARAGDMLQAACIGGQGIALLPTFMVGEALVAGELECLLHTTPMPDIAVHAVYPHNRHLSAKVRAFVDFLAARFGPRPYWDRTVEACAPGEKLSR